MKKFGCLCWYMYVFPHFLGNYFWCALSWYWLKGFFGYFRVFEDSYWIERVRKKFLIVVVKVEFGCLKFSLTFLLSCFEKKKILVLNVLKPQNFERFRVIWTNVIPPNFSLFTVLLNIFYDKTLKLHVKAKLSI